MQKARSSSSNGSEEVPLNTTKAFGDLMTVGEEINVGKGAGCPVLNDEAGKGTHTFVTVGYFTQRAQVYPVPSKDYDNCLEKMLQFLGHDCHPDHNGPGG